MNKNAIISVLVVLVIVLGAILFKTTTGGQSATAIKSTQTGAQEQISMDSLRATLSKAGITMPKQTYDLTTGQGITSFVQSTGLPSYGDLNQGQGGSGLPVSCYVYGAGGYITGWSYSNGSVGSWNLGGSIWMSCYPSFG